jgi:thiol-disulfide isomerase/thioredoxin
MKTFQRFLPLAFIILIFCGAFCFNNSEEVSVTPKGLAPDIVMKSHKGKKITLSKLKGKMVLVDFWASWCGPCRAENPFVVKAYEMYHPKGLAIVSVSLDDNETDWKAAVAKDHLNWIHVSSLKGFDEPAAKLYGISAIPQNFLIDSAGTIVAKDLRGDALAIALANCLK